LGWMCGLFFFFNDTATTEIYTLSLHDALPICSRPARTVESYTSLEEARAKLRERSESERGRFIVRYGVDKARLRNYDLVCDSTRATAQDVIEHIIAAYHGTIGGDVLRNSPPLLLLDPARVYPTEEIHNLGGLWDPEYVAEVAAAGDEALEPLSIGYTGEYFFVVDGHRRLSAALQSGFRLVPGRLVAEADEPVVGELSATDYFTSQVRASTVRDWEAAHKTRLPVPEHLLPFGDTVLAGEGAVTA